MNKKKFFLFFVLVLTLALAACTDDSSVDEEVDESTGGGEESSDADASGESGGTGDLTVGLMEDVVTVDPHGSNDSASAQVRRNVYETLVFQGVDMALEPGLATEWEATEDDVWNFQLREGTTFHSGAEFTGEDVKATLDRVRDEAIASEVAFLFEMISEVEVVGDYEVNLHTEYPFAPLPSHLAHNTGGIISKDLIDQDYQAALDEAGVDMTADEYYDLRAEGGSEYEDMVEQISEYTGSVIGTESDGTNHLQLESRSAGEEVVLSRFDDFQGGERNFENVTFRVIPENGARMAELETGGIQIADEVDSSSAPRVAEGQDTELFEQESVRMNYLGFNLEKEPFDDERVRQAISHAIDRDAIVEGVYDNMGISAQSPLAPDVWGYDEDLESVSVDMERAQELLAETEVADGFDTTIWVNDDQQIIDTAVYIQEQLADLNINVEIEQYEWGTFLDRTANGDHDMFILGWTTVTADADYGLYALFHSDSHGATGNRSFYTNEEVDALLDEGRTEADEDTRFEAYSEAQQLLIDDAPAAYLYHTNFTIGVNSSQISGAEVDPVGNIRLENVSFNE